MTKRSLIAYLLLLGLSVFSSYAQSGNSKFSLSAGYGYFSNIENLGIAPGFNNPRRNEIQSSTAHFIEFDYLLKSGYWVGIKYIEADVMYPFNDGGHLFWDKDKMISFDVYSLLIKKSFNRNKHYFDISGGPLLQDYNGVNFTYDDYDFVEIDGISYPVVLNPQVDSFQFIDLGLFLAFEYKYNITRYLNIGLKTEAYGLMYIGKQAVLFTPVIEMRY
ncbi:MAG: hypothetical protein JXB49_04390 [Bacteroidales bacterium]|nr:hypothetical protein [Bacteroidales bacterium]